MEEEKIPFENQKDNIATLSQNSLRVHKSNLKQSRDSGNFISVDENKKEDSEDSFTSISTDIQNAIHYDLLENEIYHT